MKVLITGSAGFVGSHLVEHLIQNTDWEIIGLDSFNHRGDSMRVHDLLPKEHAHRYRVYGVDLSCPISHRLAHKIGQVDFIINMASESHVDRSITHPAPFVQNNVNLAINMLEFARTTQRSLKSFIQISTDEVFGPAPEGYNHKEWECHLPSNPYAASKSAQEAIAISYWRTYGIPLVITNTMNMIGERQDPEKFLPMLIQKISKGETVTIHGSEEYIGKRFYLHSRNHADALLFLMREIKPIKYVDGDESTARPSRFNIVGDIEMNNLELAQMVAGILGKELKYELVDFHAARPGHDRRYALDGEKIAKAGWKAPVEFEASVKKTIEWTLARPEWLQ